VRAKVDVLVASGPEAVRAARRVTDSVPIVGPILGGDPVESGLVASLRRPGGNVTGMSIIDHELSGKRLEILKEALPRATRVLVPWDDYSLRSGHPRDVSSQRLVHRQAPEGREAG